MATTAAVLPVQKRAPARVSVLTAAALRALHGWHLFSLDAPTVALLWTLVFARVAHVAHAWPAALALASAVWVVYVCDRLLDAITAGDTAHPLVVFYSRNASRLLLACAVMGVLTAALLFALPAILRMAWCALALPLFAYAVAVHRLRMPGAWKPWCVGLFFGSAVVVPALVQVGLHWDWIAAAAAFGAVCLENCRLLRENRAAGRWAWPVEAALCEAWALVPLLEPETRTIAAACAAALALLWCLHRMRDRLAPLTFRALADAALVLPALLVLLLLR